MGKNNKPRWDNSSAFDAAYDSDKDLTKEEQSRIANSRNPKKEREKVWEKKGMWDKTKKMLKSSYYGDKQRKKKY